MSELMIHSFSAPEDGWLVNSHFFNTPDGVFLFDTQLLVDYAEALLAQIESEAPGQEIAAVFITHPHPDHYNGAPLIGRRAPAKFHSTRAAAKLIAKRAAEELDELKAVYKRRVPRTFIVPTELFKDSADIKWKGLTLRLSDSGPAESPTNLICYIPEAQALIAGDLVYNRVHLKLADGNPEAWRRALGRLKGLKLKRIYPGHGPAAGPEIISHLIRYLDHFQMAVAYFAEGKNRAESDDRRRIIGAMCDKYPDYHLPENLEAGIDAELARQRGKKVA